jgi:hypothetical protein
LEQFVDYLLEVTALIPDAVVLIVRERFGKVPAITPCTTKKIDNFFGQLGGIRVYNG